MAAMEQEEIEYQIESIHGCLLAHEIALQLVLSRSPQALDALQDIDLERLEAQLRPQPQLSDATIRTAIEQLRRFQSVGG
jgi:hypothetical protein